jgi:hydroxymethylbilane synthase
VLLARPEDVDDAAPLGLKPGAILGTSAVRRRAQAQSLDVTLEVRELRGNVPTRVEKLRRGEYAAILLAAAGLNRLALDLSDLHVRTLEHTLLVPAPGQGALALECRDDDTSVIGVLQTLEVSEARLTVSAERGLMARLQGGCQLALGASARLEASAIHLTAWYEGQLYQTSAPGVEEVIERAFALLHRDHPEAVSA